MALSALMSSFAQEPEELLEEELLEEELLEEELLEEEREDELEEVWPRALAPARSSLPAWADNGVTTRAMVSVSSGRSR